MTHPRTHNSKESAGEKSERSSGKRKRGFIQIIVLVIVALILLRVLGFSITDILAKPAVHEFAVTVKTMLKAVWQDLKEIFGFFKAA